MLNKNSFQIIKVLTLLIVILTFNNYSFAKHKKPQDYICVPEEKRTKNQKAICQLKMLTLHGLCKLDIECAIKGKWEAEQGIIAGEKKLKELEELIKEKEDMLKGTASCSDLNFNHKAREKTSIYKLPKKSSEIIGKVKKNQDLLLISSSEKNKKWDFVKIIKKGGICADGFIEQKLVMKKGGVDIIVKAGPKLIDIIDPKWEIEDKLIAVEAEGTVSITGVIQEGKIDKVIINEDEEIINDDNTFNYVTFVTKSGSEIRIIGSKNNKKVKELTFEIKIK